MIETTHQCRQCGSTDLVKNGQNASGSRQYHCKACGAYLVLAPKERGYPEEEKERILRAYRERGSMRAIERVFGVSRNTLSRWLEKRDVSSPT
jgi:transposase-like protein